MNSATIIKFACPNGHRLSCSQQQAGTRGKCPKCGVTFVVPEAGDVDQLLNEMGANLSGEVDSTVAMTTVSAEAAQQYDTSTSKIAAEGQKSRTSSNGPAEKPTKPGQIVFLCPNGHRLHGPESMVGKAGQCPHCGTKFTVPSPEDSADEDEADELGEQSVINVAGSRNALDDLPIDYVDDQENVAVTAPSSRMFRFGHGVQSSLHPLAQLFASLWVYHEQGATIELHMGEGKILIPDGYSPLLSHQGYGLFAIKEANRTVTLTAVAWASIQRVTVRGVKDIPDGMFEGYVSRR